MSFIDTLLTLIESSEAMTDQEKKYICPTCKKESSARDGHFDCSPSPAPDEQRIREEWIKGLKNANTWLGTKDEYANVIADYWIGILSQEIAKAREEEREKIGREIMSTDENYNGMTPVEYWFNKLTLARKEI